MKKKKRKKKNNRYTVDTEFQTNLLLSLTLFIQREDQRKIGDNRELISQNADKMIFSLG